MTSFGLASGWDFSHKRNQPLASGCAVNKIAMVGAAGFEPATSTV